MRRDCKRELSKEGLNKEEADLDERFTIVQWTATIVLLYCKFYYRKSFSPPSFTGRGIVCEFIALNEKYIHEHGSDLIFSPFLLLL